MPSLFGNSNKDISSVKYFEIRLEESNIILRGGEDEAPSALLKGTLVLCLSEPLQIKGIRLRFTGEKRIAWYQQTSSGANYVKAEEEFMRKTWEFKRSTEVLPADNYEWPFDQVIPGSTPESLEGLTDSWIIYRMKATIERGVLQTNSLARRQVRIIRSLDPTALELSHSMAVENLWPNKIQYSLSTPMKAVIFGSNIFVQFKLIPLLKGLKLGKIVTELVEKQEMHMRGPKVMTRSRNFARTIQKDEYTMPEDTATEEIEGQEGYQFARSISVPHSLRKCVQTMDGLGIKIRHTLSFNVQLHNPDGHVSELHATLPVYIFLSPNLPIDENNNLVDYGGRLPDSATALSDLTPPQYGEHQFDQLYSEIDPSGYTTPRGTRSGLSTPLQIRSRSISAENIHQADMTPSTAIPVGALHSRLNNLDSMGNLANRGPRDRSQLATSGDGLSSPGSRTNGESHDDDDTPRNASVAQNGSAAHPQEGTSSDSASPEDLSPRTSGEEEQQQQAEPQSPQHVEFSVEDLVKVPSYSTALKSNPRTPISAGLPSYHAAVRIPLPPSRIGSQSLTPQVGRGSI